MSRRPTKLTGVKLPHSLQQELGLQLQTSGPRGRRRNASVGNRKQQRKAARIQRRAVKSAQNERGARKTLRGELENDESSDSSDERDPVLPPTSKASTKIERLPRSNAAPQKQKPIPKRAVPPTSEDDSEQYSSSRESSPGLVLDSTSRAFKDRAEQDDEYILALEKKLGLKKKTKSNPSEIDGLDGLLNGFDSEDEGKKRKHEADEWLATKRRKASGLGASESDDSISLDPDDIDLGHNDVVSSEEESSRGEDEDFAGFDSGLDETTLGVPSKRPRENPYLPPVDPERPAGKYVPPSMRKKNDQDSEFLTRLRRQVQGHLNKLSEANLISILNEIENLYQNNARQDLTSTLTDLLLSLFCDRSGLQSTFVILHAAFIAAIYKVIGTDFGAEVVSKLVERFESFYSRADPTTDKETVNLISLLSHLYTFHVINSTIIFDYIRTFLTELNESSTELLLKVVRDCGPQLRQDDPSSLKGIVQTMQNSAAKIAAEGKETSIRTRFMIETITDLKNNKMKAATNTSGVASEHITLLRKVLGSLNSRNLRAAEPLRIGLNDIKDSERKGKWWLVGASWKGHDPRVDGLPTDASQAYQRSELDSQESDLLALARQYQMNTDVRRSIFVAIMSASDWQDAHLRLMKLRLKRSQEQEIPKVLLRCVGAEAVYNPYYTLITKKLCSDKRVKMAFQFVLWDFFKRMGEKGDVDDSDDDEGEQSVELSEIVNLAKMYGHLIADGALAIGVLKILNLAYVKEQAKMFVELLLIVVFTQTHSAKSHEIDEKRLVSIFGRATETPQVVQGLQVFLKKHVRHSDLVSERESLAVKQGCKVALKVLDQITAHPV